MIWYIYIIFLVILPYKCFQITQNIKIDLAKNQKIRDLTSSTDKSIFVVVTQERKSFSNYICRLYIYKALNQEYILKQTIQIAKGQCYQTKVIVSKGGHRIAFLQYYQFIIFSLNKGTYRQEWRHNHYWYIYDGELSQDGEMLVILDYSNISVYQVKFKTQKHVDVKNGYYKKVKLSLNKEFLLHIGYEFINVFQFDQNSQQIVKHLSMIGDFQHSYPTAEFSFDNRIITASTKDQKILIYPYHQFSQATQIYACFNVSKINRFTQNTFVIECFNHLIILKQLSKNKFSSIQIFKNLTQKDFTFNKDGQFFVAYLDQNIISIGKLNQTQTQTQTQTLTQTIIIIMAIVLPISCCFIIGVILIVIAIIYRNCYGFAANNTQASGNSVQNLHKVQLNQLKQFVCSICLQHFSTHQAPCKHKFHKKCIQLWIQGNRSCPQCRRPLNNLELKKI